jgi:hypothetical protein
MSQPKIFISGTGRAGTTFLVQLLTQMGEDTGFKSGSGSRYYPQARAGLELNFLKPGGPRIMKSPHLCDRLAEALSVTEISHVIIPVRNFEEAAASRRLVQFETTGSEDGKPVKGGLWGTEIAADQADVLRRKFCGLVEGLLIADIPMTLLAFPRLATDPNYLFQKLRPIFPHWGERQLREAFTLTAKADMIHSFKEA